MQLVAYFWMYINMHLFLISGSYVIVWTKNTVLCSFYLYFLDYEPQPYSFESDIS